MPHVTEEIWSFLPGERGLLAAGRLARRRARSPTTRRPRPSVGRAIEAITELRRYREQAGVKPSAILPARLSAEGYEAHGRAGGPARAAGAVGRTATRAAEVPVPGRHGRAAAHRRLRPGEAERRIAARARASSGSEIARLEKKLANERFVERAPAEVVEGEREKLDGYRRALESLG